MTDLEQRIMDAPMDGAAESWQTIFVDMLSTAGHMLDEVPAIYDTAVEIGEDDEQHSIVGLRFESDSSAVAELIEAIGLTLPQFTAVVAEFLDPNVQQWWEAVWLDGALRRERTATGWLEDADGDRLMRVTRFEHDRDAMEWQWREEVVPASTALTVAQDTQWSGSTAEEAVAFVIGRTPESELSQ
ncbi:hypothetical protein FQ330_03285 [Agrococcus sediminis]|uniref:Uncharacterized protein n=1 Tax=Agrococcus sediminis TaxID=2599924 RepID=A0A5M8QMM2_9MICO|nr:hypothetical protein [Agrococcus sediminis]KAA6436441.1 hypothetical protein FQ330_03285 [Agrococcus sediminis]